MCVCVWCVVCVGVCVCVCVCMCVCVCVCVAYVCACMPVYRVGILLEQNLQSIVLQCIDVKLLPF